MLKAEVVKALLYVWWRERRSRSTTPTCALPTTTYYCGSTVAARRAPTTISHIEPPSRLQGQRASTRPSESGGLFCRSRPAAGRHAATEARGGSETGQQGKETARRTGEELDGLPYLGSQCTIDNGGCLSPVMIRNIFWSRDERVDSRCYHGGT